MIPGGWARLSLPAVSTLLLAAPALQAGLARMQPSEVRALWVVRTTLASPASIDRAIEAAVEGGFRTLYVQAVGRGDALFPSAFLPPSPLITKASGPDPFGTFLSRAHEHGLEVHVWINVLYAWSAPSLPRSPRHVLRRHPDWIAVDAEDEGGGTGGLYPGDAGTDRFLSPALPSVRAYVQSIVREILGRYPVDGVHLDYLRYPSADSGLEEPSRAGFRRIYRVDPLDLFRHDGDGGGGMDPGARARYRSLWTLWRARQVTDLLRDLRRTQESIAPDVVLSAAVIPDITRARERYGQDWVRWVDEGLIDRVILMAYSSRPEEVRRQAKEALRRAGPDRVTLGIAAYNQPLGQLVQTVRDLREMGVRGFSFFSYNTMLDLPGAFVRIRRDLFGAGPERGIGPRAPAHRSMYRATASAPSRPPSASSPPAPLP